MSDTRVLDGNAPFIILHDANPLRMLDAELAVRALVNEGAEVRTLADPAQARAALDDPRTLLALLDGDAAENTYALNAPDPRIVWMRERPDRTPPRVGPVVLKPLRQSELRALPPLAALVPT